MNKFKKGDKVKSTQLAIDRGVFKRPRKGIVDSNPSGDTMVRVRAYHAKYAETYKVDFWEIDNEEELGNN